MCKNIRPVFDSGLTLTQVSGQNVINGFVLFRYRLIGEKGLAGSTLTIENLNRTAMDTLVNISLLDGSHYSLLLKPRENAIEIPQAETGLQLVFSYTRLGIEHMKAGIT